MRQAHVSAVITLIGAGVQCCQGTVRILFLGFSEASEAHKTRGRDAASNVRNDFPAIHVILLFVLE
jgi:hypothetical protein